MNSIVVSPNDSISEIIQSSPATSLLGKKNTSNSVRTQKSILFRLVEILNPPSLAEIIADLESRGMHRHDIIHLFPWYQLTYSEVIRVRARLAKEYVPTRANSMLCALRTIIRECWLAGLMPLDDYEKSTAVKGIKLQTKSTSSIVSDEELSSLFKVFQARGPIGLRDATMLTLMCSGLSPGECANLDVSDYDSSNDALNIEPMSSRLHGRKRTIYLGPKIKGLLNSWLKYRGHEKGPLFPQMVVSQHVSGKIVAGYPRLTVHGIYCVFARHEDLAGLTHHRLLDYRKTFIEKLFDQHIDELTIAKVSGISSADYLKIYNPLPEESKKQAANQVFQQHML